MKKFITGLRYGNWLTRIFLISVPLCIVVALVLIVLSFVLNLIYLLLIGIAFGIVAVALSQSFTLEEVDAQQPVKNDSKGDNTQIREEELSEEAFEETATKMAEDIMEETEDELAEEEDLLFEKKKKTKKKKNKKERIKKEKVKKQKVKKEADEEESESNIEIESKDERMNEEPSVMQEKTVAAEKTKFTKDSFKSYDEQRIKQVFYKYKVRKDHRLIIIDEWKEKEVRQTPAYVWRHRKQLHFLLIEEGVRELSVPINKAGVLTYQKGIICQAKDEYVQFRNESLLAQLFTPYLPTYHEGDKNGRPVVYKNLFEFGNGIRITNPSARVLMDMIGLEAQVDDIVTRDVRYNAYFKRIYTQAVLFREQVINGKEYQEQINDILQEFAASDIATQEYDDTLQLMNQHKLITQEYVSYYQQYRVRILLEAQANAGRKGKKRG